LTAVGAAGATPPARLFGIPIAPLTLEEVLGRVEAAVASRQRLQIGVVNAAKIVNMRRDPLLREDVLTSDLILADGTSVVWAGRLLGVALPERVAGIDLMHAMLRRGEARGWRFFLLGATPEVLAAAVGRIHAEHPSVVVSGCSHGYYAPEEEEGVAEAIRTARPDILLVAMTSPKKERFLARWSGRLDVPVWHGVGGSLDVLAGKVRRAPEAWQRLGLEWLYRVKQEPRRLWKRYLVTNSIFCAMVLGQLVRQSPPPSGTDKAER
jgi:N-acetylglucosaminyldiphosphoundecaprenol N-acetyl-beta-D-mannosaminyltransferase